MSVRNYGLSKSIKERPCTVDGSKRSSRQSTPTIIINATAEAITQATGTEGLIKTPSVAYSYESTNCSTDIHRNSTERPVTARPTAIRPNSEKWRAAQVFNEGRLNNHKTTMRPPNTINNTPSYSKKNKRLYSMASSYVNPIDLFAQNLSDAVLDAQAIDSDDLDELYVYYESSPYNLTPKHWPSTSKNQQLLPSLSNSTCTTSLLTEQQHYQRKDHSSTEILARNSDSKDPLYLETLTTNSFTVHASLDETARVAKQDFGQSSSSLRPSLSENIRMPLLLPSVNDANRYKKKRPTFRFHVSAASNYQNFYDNDVLDKETVTAKCALLLCQSETISFRSNYSVQRKRALYSKSTISENGRKGCLSCWKICLGVISTCALFACFSLFCWDTMYRTIDKSRGTDE